MTVQIQVSLTSELAAKLDTAAKVNNISVSKYVRQVLDRELNK